MEYQKADRDYIRLSIAFEGRAKQANELLRNFDSISELFETVKSFDSDILTTIKREQAEKLRLTASDAYIDDFISDLEKNGVSALTPNSEAYRIEIYCGSAVCALCKRQMRTIAGRNAVCNNRCKKVFGLRKKSVRSYGL